MLTRSYPFLDPARITRELSQRLQLLASDCSMFETNELFVISRLRTAPVLNSYVPVLSPIGLRLIGQVTHHPLLGSRKIITSQLWFADPEGNWVRTLSRFYRLGRPAHPDDSSQMLNNSSLASDAGDEDLSSGEIH